MMMMMKLQHRQQNSQAGKLGLSLSLKKKPAEEEFDMYETPDLDDEEFEEG